jgi:hypothetical protein
LKVHQQFPELAVLNKVLYELIVEVVRSGGTASQVEQSLVHEAPSELVVAAVKFSVGFFYKKHPDFVGMRR